MVVIQRVFWFLLPLCFSGSIQAACVVTDDAGTTFNFNKSMQRIISLAPDTTEVLFAIGANSQLVGVIKGSDYPHAALALPVVGSYSGLDLEKIISLHPDLIITWGNNFSRQLAVLKETGIPIYINTPKDLYSISKTMRHLACLTGRQAQGDKLATNYLNQLSELQKKYHSKNTISVFYQMGDYSLLTINKDSWINAALALCGGRNIFANLSLPAPEVTWEAVVSAKPEAIIADADQTNWTQRWQRWSSIPAVKNNFLFTINPDLLQRAGPRLVLGVKKVCEDLDKVR